MWKLTISMAICHSYVSHYQRVNVRSQCSDVQCLGNCLFVWSPHVVQWCPVMTSGHLGIQQLPPFMEDVTFYQGLPRKSPNKSPKSGWWFGTCFIFPYIWNNHPNWLSYFSGWNHQPANVGKYTMHGACMEHMERLPRPSWSPSIPMSSPVVRPCCRLWVRCPGRENGSRVLLQWGRTDAKLMQTY